MYRADKYLFFRKILYQKTEDDILIYRNAPKDFYACYVFSYEFLMFLYMDEDLLWEKILLITNQKQRSQKVKLRGLIDQLPSFAADYIYSKELTTQPSTLISYCYDR